MGFIAGLIDTLTFHKLNAPFFMLSVSAVRCMVSDQVFSFSKAQHLFQYTHMIPLDHAVADMQKCIEPPLAVLKREARV